MSQPLRFAIRWFDASAAEVHVAEVEAVSAEQAALALAQPGRVVLSVERARSPGAAPLMRGGGSARLDVAWWCRELRTLVTAGMTVVEALETLHAQPLGQARAQVHAALVDHLRQGRALSAAMQATGAFPMVLVAGVKASERTSALVEALDDYLRYHEMLDRLRRQVISASLYPAVVVALGLAICVFLLAYVMPRFARMYTDLRGPTSWATQALLGISQALSQHGLLFALVLLAVAGLAVLAWRSGRLLRWASRCVDAIGPLRHRIDEFRLAKLYHSLALMFRGGYALDDALGQCAALGLGARLATGVQAARTGLARGQRVSAALGEAGLTDTVSQRLLAVGERTGNFDRVLQTIAERHAANFSTFVERATRIVEPVLLLLVALLVGGIVVMMYMPVFDIASSVR